MVNNNGFSVGAKKEGKAGGKRRLMLNDNIGPSFDLNVIENIGEE